MGRGVAQLLAAADQQVLDVPAKLAARARLLGAGSARKTDATDAASVGAVTQRNERLRPVQAENHTVVLRLLSDRRDDLVAERTRTLNRLHVLLRDLHPGGAKRDLSTLQATAPVNAQASARERRRPEPAAGPVTAPGGAGHAQASVAGHDTPTIDICRHA